MKLFLYGNRDLIPNSMSPHIQLSYKKSTYETLWNLEYEKIHSTCLSKLQNKDIVASHQDSNIVIDVIISEPSAESDKLELIVRKTAHLIEYAALGMAVMLFVKRVEKDYCKKLYGAELFCVLFIAVVDEYIQSFSNRTSSTGDVLLDFIGALIGFALVLVIHFIYVKLKNRKLRS